MVTVCWERRTNPNGRYLQRVQRERGFGIYHSQKSNPPFTKKNKARSFQILASYEAEGAQGLKKPNI
jgi:hypothetical protein